MNPGERRGPRGLAVYEAPPVPEGWHGHDVIRIIDPLGVQAAWVAPDLGGSLIAWFVRRAPEDPWHQALGATGRVPGGEILVPDPDSSRCVPASEGTTRWGFIERDPTAVTVCGQVDGGRMAMTLRCDEGLHVEFHAGEGARIAGYRLRLHHELPAAVRLSSDSNACLFGSGPVTRIEWSLGAGLRAQPETARGAPWHIDIVPDGHAGHDREPAGFVLTAICGNR